MIFPIYRLETSTNLSDLRLRLNVSWVNMGLLLNHVVLMLECLQDNISGFFAPAPLICAVCSKSDNKGSFGSQKTARSRLFSVNYSKRGR